MAAASPEGEINESRQRANDFVADGVDSTDVPENHFGNSEGNLRRCAGSRPENQNPESSTCTTTSASNESEAKGPTTAQNESPEAEISTDDVLEHGLGLVLRNSNSSPVGATGTHNWQSNKHSIKSRLVYLLNTGVLADVTFIVGGSSLLMSSSITTSTTTTIERFVAHKFVLSMSSAVFDAMLNGQMAERDESAISIPDVEPTAFRALLKFLYTDEISVESDTVMSILYAAKKYAIPALEQECVEFLKENITSDNVFMLLTQARLFDEPALARLCLDAIDKSTTEALSSDTFIDLDRDTLCLVLSRDTLGIREGSLFSALVKWAEHECVKQQLEITSANMRSVLGDAVRLIRYPLMTVEEFAVQVAQSKILTDEEMVELFLYFTINPKPTIHFSDKPRSCLTGNEQLVSRFCQVDHRWGYSGSSDKIK